MIEVAKITYNTHYLDAEDSFPTPTSLRVVMNIKGYPKALTDGYMVEISASDVDIKKASKGAAMDKSILDKKLEKLPSTSIELPQYSVLSDEFDYFILMNPITNRELGLQMKYYNYFFKKYPGCDFRQDDEQSPIIVFKSRDSEPTKANVIGLIMPVIPHTDYKKHMKKDGKK